MDDTLERIVKCIGPKHGAKKQLAEYLGIHPNVITNWLNGRNRSYRRYLDEIAQYFNVSVSYLKGNTDQKNFDLESEEMYKIFEELLNLHGITAYKVAKETGISTSTMTEWKKGKYVPKADKLQKIADYFGVSLEYLMTGKTSEKKTPAPETRDGKGKNLVRTIGRDGSYSERWLTDEQLEALQAIINQMPDVEDDF